MSPNSKNNPRNDTTGTVTSANASKINDGACSLVLVSESGAKDNQIEPHFEIISYADAELSPIDFNKTPAIAIEKALKRANLSLNEIDYFEINEVFCIFLVFLFLICRRFL